MRAAGEMSLEIAGLTAGYGNLNVFRDFDMKVHRGEAVGILGPNGHGKTTLMRAISGLVEIRKGQIELDGSPVGHLGPEARRLAGIGHVPQGDLLFANLTVEENIVAGAYPRSSWKDRAAKLDAVYTLFPELKARRTSLSGNLSGGERRMVAIARATMAPARILLVDEPSIGLAPSAIQRVYQSLQHIREEGTTIVLVEETLARVEKFVDRIYLLDHGKVVADATPAALARDEQLRRTYLG